MSRGANDEGANAVEFALVLPVLLILLFGMITGGVTLNQKLSLEQANRESARWGATLPVDNFAPYDSTTGVDRPADAWFADVANLAVNTSNSYLGDGVTTRFVCVAFIFVDGTDDRSKSLTWDGVTATMTGGNETSSGTQCFTDNIANTEPHVQVVVRSEGWLDVIFWSSNPTIESRSVARYEPETPW